MNAAQLLDSILGTRSPAARLAEWIPRTKGETIDRLTRIKIELSRKLFREFFRNAWQTMEPETPLDESWHIDALCDHVQWLFEEWATKRENIAYEMQVQNILFNIPPRCLKSKIISVAAVAWAWIRWPHMTFITLSANPRVAQDNAEDCLKLIESEWYREWFRPDWRVAVDRSAVSNFALERVGPKGDTTRLGWRKSRGWSAKITGEGADCILPDDPHDAEEAQGKVAREAVIRRWSAIRNRVRDRRVSIRMGVMQRLHEADWTGYVLKNATIEGSQKWTLVRLPLHYNSKKPTRTRMPVNDGNRYARDGLKTWCDPRSRDGEILDPIRFTPEVIAQERIAMGPYNFSAQMENDPVSAEGGQFKREFWRWYSMSGQPNQGYPRPEKANALPTRVLDCKPGKFPHFDWVALSVDCTFGDSAKSDNVGMMVIAGIKADRFVLYDGTAKMDITKTMATIRELKAIYKCTIVLIEKKANGQAVIDLMLSEVGSLVPIEPEGGKDSRAHSNVPMIAAGNIYLLEGAQWSSSIIDEHAAFPRGEHDDRVDALSQCLTYYRDPIASKVRASCKW